MEKIEEKIITYKENCPNCKAEQIGKFELDVDKPCYKCKNEVLMQKFKKEHEFLIGSVITEFEMNGDVISKIIIKSKDGNFYTINSYNNSYGDDETCLKIEEE